MKLIKFALLLPLLLILSSCASIQEDGSVYDPFEPTNRVIFKFNDTADEYLIQPIAKTYMKLPELLRQGINNFLGNLGDFISLINNMLQLKPEQASNDLMRITINSTFGLGGIFDLATPLNIERTHESFADTLGYWGVDAGPYLVLPFLGPSNLRDAPSLVVDTYTHPIGNIDNVRLRNSLQATKLVNSRANLLKVSNLTEDVSFDPYTFQRDFYHQFRQNRIYDGDPPLTPFGDEEDIFEGEDFE